MMDEVEDEVEGEVKVKDDGREMRDDGRWTMDDNKCVGTALQCLSEW